MFSISNLFIASIYFVLLDMSFKYLTFLSSSVVSPFSQQNMRPITLRVLCVALLLPALFMALDEPLAHIRTTLISHAVSAVVLYFATTNLIDSMKVYLLKRGTLVA